MCTRSVRVLFSNKYLLSSKKQVSNKFKYFWCKYKYLVKNWTCFKHFEPFGSISNLSAKNKTFYDLKMFVHFIHIELLLYSHPLIKNSESLLEFSRILLEFPLNFLCINKMIPLLVWKMPIPGWKLNFYLLVKPLSTIQIHHWVPPRATTWIQQNPTNGSTKGRCQKHPEGGESLKFAAAKPWPPLKILKRICTPP